MAPGKTRTRAASTAAKSKSKSEPDTTENSREARAARDEALTKEILKQRKADVKWQEIADELGIAVGKAIFLHEKATAGVDEAIPWKNEAELTKKVIAARNAKEPLSWGKIAARTGVGEAKIKRLAAEGGLEAGHRIGKGGRHTGGGAPAQPKVRQRAKAATASTKPAKAAGKARTRVRITK